MSRFSIRHRLALAVVGVVAAGLSPTLAAGAISAPPAPAAAAVSQADQLDRGVINVRTGQGNRISWRQLADDPAGTTFNVYRNGVKVNSKPISGPTTYVDAGGAR